MLLTDHNNLAVITDQSWTRDEINLTITAFASRDCSQGFNCIVHTQNQSQHENLCQVLEAHCWLGNQPGYLRQSTINQDTFGQFSDLNHSDSWLHTAAHWLRWHLISCQNTIRKYVNPSVSTPVCYKIFVTANFWMCANHWTIANHRKSLDNTCGTHACSMVHVACIICIYVCSNL